MIRKLLVAIILLLIGLIVLVSCQAPPDATTDLYTQETVIVTRPTFNAEISYTWDSDSKGWERMVDLEAGVVCYNKASTFCLPMGDTRLGK